jgi:pimeloyl-ACP methyl ester carboxylesterase
MPQLTLDRATIAYRELGPAESPHPPVLFVHGALVDETLWSAVATALADRGFRCILPTWPLGSHTIPVTDRSVLSPSGVAELIGQFIVALDLDDVTLVGNDTGGGLCQFLVDAHPDRIGRLVLTNCDAFEQFPPFPFNRVFALLTRPAMLRTLMAPMSFTPVRHSALGFGLLLNDPDPAQTAAWLAPCRRDPRIAGDFAALARHIGQTDLTDVAPRLGRFTRPVHILWGTADRCFTPDLGRRLAAAFPHSVFTEISGARTFVPVDNPGVVIDAIAQLGARTG